MGQEVVTYEEKWAVAGRSYADKEKSDAKFISTQGGILAIGDEELPGNQMCVVILHSIFENTFYDERFDEDKIVPPRCFAMAEEQEDLTPHESMAKALEWFQPQVAKGESCSDCPMNEWGSSPVGKGKACSNRRRLAVIPAGQFIKQKGSKDYDVDIFEEEEHYKEAEMFFLKLPVMSGKEYARFVKQATNEHNRPPFGVIAHVWPEDDKKAQFKIKFDIIDTLPDEMYPIIAARHEEAAKALLEHTYSSPDEDSGERKSARRNLDGLRKGK